jgi:hypothetical protein
MSFLINPFVFAAAGGDFESIATVTVGSGGASSIEFTSIPGTYQHLHLRVMALMNGANQALWLRFNDDAATNYSCHFLYGTGSAAAAGSRLSDGGIDSIFQPTSSGKEFCGVIDILDYANTSKHKVIRVLHGSDSNGAGYVGINSGSWRNTDAITKILVSDQIGASSFNQHATIALYGIKAP